MRRRGFLAQATSFFAVASFFAEGAVAMNAPVARQVTSTSNSAAALPTPSLAFINGLGQPITCATAEIDWFYDGVDGTFTFIVTNVGVQQDVPAPSKTSTQHYTDDPATPGVAARAVPTGVDDSTTKVIGMNIDAKNFLYVWNPVNVASGWYILKASMASTAYTIDSAAFFVYNGTDSSCLTSTTTTSAISTVTPSQTAISSSSTPSTTAVPVGGASSAKVSTGAIVGIIIGAVAVVAACLLAWLCFLRRPRRSNHASGGSGGGVPGIGRWNGLKSADSRGGLMGNSSSRSLRHPSVGTIPMSPSEEAVAGAEKNSIHSRYGDANPFDAPPVALAALPVMQHPAARSRSTGGISRTYSISSSISNGYPVNEYTSSPSARRPSVPDSVLGGRPSMDSTTYPPSSPQSLRNSAQFIPATSITRSHSLSTSATHQTSATNIHGGAQSTTSHAGLFYHNQASSHSPSTSPTAYSDASNPLSSSSSDAARQGARQSQGAKKRKPVPAYDPSSERTSPVPPIPSSSSPSPVPPSPSPVPDHTPHYTTRSQAGHDHSQPELVHKSSFGPGGVEGKPLHYLIPDMPMPVRD